MSNPTTATAPTTIAEFMTLVRKSGVLDEKRFQDLFPEASDLPADPQRAAVALIRAGLLTGFQAKSILAGKFRGFILGTYKILEPLGKGGMGAVFLGEHATLKRKVALKVLPTDKALDRLTLERFYREARAAAALDHPNIVRLHDISQGGGVHFLVMEYVDGTDLQSLMAKTGPLHYAQAAQYIAQAAAGLQHAHEKGFVHRDIKPANLMLTKDGTIKILDMGLARSFTDEKDNLTGQLGSEADVAGTADYISPEQAMSQPVDERSDVYSLGATLFALITGHPPFKGSTAQKLMQHQLKEPPSLLKLKGMIPPALSEVVGKMMAKRPSERYQSAADVIDALGPWLPAPTTGNVVQDPFRTGDIPASMTTRMGGTKSMTSADPATPVPAASATSLTLPTVVHFPVPVKWAVGGLAAAILLVGGLIGYLASGGKSKDTAQVAPPAPVNSAPGPFTAPAPAARTNPAAKARPVSTPRPAAKGFGPEKLAYKLDLAGAKPVAVRGGAEGTGDPAEDVRLVPTGKTGDGELPAGWRGMPWDHSAEAEYSVGEKAGRPALGMKNLRLGSTSPSVGTAMFFAPRLDLPAGKARVRFEYLTDSSNGRAGQLKFKSTNPVEQAWMIEDLPGTGGRWVAYEREVELRGSAGGYFEVHAFDTDPNRGLYLSAFEVLTPGPAVAAGAGKAVYRLAAADFPDFRYTKQGSQLMDGQYPAFPQGTYLHGWKPETVAEYWCETIDGGKAFGWRHVSGPASAQLGLDLEGADWAINVPLTPGKEYRIRVPYKMTGGGGGRVYVQYQGKYTQVEGAETNLGDTAGQWQTAEFTFTKPAEPIRMCVDSYSTAPDVKLYVREVVIEEVRTENIIYASDFATVKPFRLSRSPRGNIPDPGLPKGWRVDMWQQETAGEVRADVDGGQVVLAATNVSGPASCQYAFDPEKADLPPLTTGHPYEVRIEYRVDDGQMGKLNVQCVGGNWEFINGANLNPGGWQTVTVAFEVPDGRKPQFTVMAQHAAPGKYVYLRSLELIDKGTPTAAAPARPAPTTPVSRVQPAAVGGLPYRLDLRAPFTVLKEWRNGTLATDGTVELPGGWTLADPAEGTSAEVSVIEVDGKLALELRKLDGTAPVQLAQQSAAATLKAGKRYRLRFEYRGEDGATGQAEVRPAGKAVTAAKLDLGTTGGKWEWRELDVTPTAELPAAVAFQNLSTRPGNAMYFRSVELIDAGR